VHVFVSACVCVCSSLRVLMCVRVRGCLCVRERVLSCVRTWHGEKEV